LDELSEKLIETAVKETIQPIYKDAISPTLQEIGSFTQDALKTIRLLTAPIQYCAHLQDRLVQHLEKSLKNIPKEKLVKPHDSIQIPILEQLKNYQNEEQYDEVIIAKMFQNLLSSAYNKDTSKLVHPRFSKIISDLSPDEALLFHHMAEKIIFCSDFDILKKSLKEIHNKTYISMYFNNLKQLGLIKIHNYTDKNSFTTSNKYTYHRGITVENDKIYEVTDFGLLFYDIINIKE
jgi:hypothetical protein